MLLRLCWWCCVLLVALVGCTPGSDGVTTASFGPGQLGDPCQKTEDCASGWCVRSDDKGGICTLTCEDATSCPAGDNWGCLQTDDPQYKLCACRKLADSEICNNGSDDECNGKIDDCRTCNGVAVANDDLKNCGKCGNACTSGQVCHGGQCSCPQASPDACGDRCTTLKTDANNCSKCGLSCGSGRSCQDGSCTCPNAATPDYCDGAGCLSLQSDVSHCGKCDVACGLGQVCAEGGCACPTSAAPDYCDDVGCVDQQSDGKNCGECGKVCDAGFTCSKGECTCPEGQVDCDGACVDIGKSAENCGKCGKACAAGQACADGVCSCTAAGLSVCGSACANLKTDVANCGACGSACAPGENCSNGVCGCASGVHCGGTCVAASDTNNCGACGNQCGAAQICSNGTCSCQGFGLGACGTTCKDLKNDALNCGACGNLCPNGQQCSGGVCQCLGSSYCPTFDGCFDLSHDAKHCGACSNACNPTEQCALGVCTCPVLGQLYCAAQNRCLDVKSDTQNCGACGKACNSGEICAAGVCKCSLSTSSYCAAENTCVDTYSNVNDCGACAKVCKPTQYCSAGTCTCGSQTFCDNANACVDTWNSASNCGSCGKVCNPTQVCSSGACKCPSTGQTYCANALSCVTLATDSANCGACNNQCPSATHCTASSCKCDVAGQSLCGSTCFDLQTDSKNCGACGNVCPGTMACSAGVCRCSDPTLGTTVRITNDSLDESELQAQWDGSHVGLAYRQRDGVENIHLALLNPDGTLFKDTAVTNYTLVTGAPTPLRSGPASAWTGTEYGIVWTQPFAAGSMVDVMFQRVTSDGTLVGPQLTVASQINAYDVLNVGITWSPAYGGYAVTYGDFSLNFRRIGATGTTLEPANNFAALSDDSRNRPLALAVQPNGRWGVLSSTGNWVNFIQFEADGSNLSGVQSIYQGAAYYQGVPGNAWLLYDGQNFWQGFPGWMKTTNNNTFYVNRGSTKNNPVALFPDSTTVAYDAGNMAMVNGTLAVGFTERLPPALSFKFRLQRFTLSSGTTSAVTALHNAVDILSTYTIGDSKIGDMQLVATGKYSMLGIWADTRWGATNRELYARPIDLQSCP